MTSDLAAYLLRACPKCARGDLKLERETGQLVYYACLCCAWTAYEGTARWGVLMANRRTTVANLSNYKTCERCGHLVGLRYTAYDPESEQIVRVCNACDKALATLRDGERRYVVTEPAGTEKMSTIRR